MGKGGIHVLGSNFFVRCLLFVVNCFWCFYYSLVMFDVHTCILVEVVLVVDAT